MQVTALLPGCKPKVILNKYLKEYTKPKPYTFALADLFSFKSVISKASSTLNIFSKVRNSSMHQRNNQPTTGHRSQSPRALGRQNSAFLAHDHWTRPGSNMRISEYRQLACGTETPEGEGCRDGCYQERILQGGEQSPISVFLTFQVLHALKDRVPYALGVFEFFVYVQGNWGCAVNLFTPSTRQN